MNTQWWLDFLAVPDELWVGFSRAVLLGLGWILVGSRLVGVNRDWVRIGIGFESGLGSKLDSGRALSDSLPNPELGSGLGFRFFQAALGVVHRHLERTVPAS